MIPRPHCRSILWSSISGLGCSVFIPAVALAQTLPVPGAADAARIRPQESVLMRSARPVSLHVPEMSAGIPAPAEAKLIHLTLPAITIEGATIFNQKELQKLTDAYVARDITLDQVWSLAEAITHHYHEAGYFLSRAYIPAQELGQGKPLKIAVAEGAIDAVHLPEAYQKNPIVLAITSALTVQRPLTSAALESAMLRLNDIPGVHFSGVLHTSQNAQDGLVDLTVTAVQKSAIRMLGVNNHGSTFLGPTQAMASYQASLLEDQQTTFTTSTTTPIEEMIFAAINHEIMLSPDLSMELSGNWVKAAPGGSLKINEIESVAKELAASIHWRIWRQRLENLRITFRINGQNSFSTILGNTRLTRDHLRMVHTEIHYDAIDTRGGNHALNTTITRGIEGLGSSQAGDLDLSRAGAVPNFTTVAADYTTQQPLPASFVWIGKLAGQWASDPLYSAREIGYGGQNFGRAYDPSEITGDDGLMAGMELHYQGIKPVADLHVTPFGFYDAGKVWNRDVDSKPISAASAGIGLQISHSSGASGNVGLAWPLTKPINAPIRGDANDPRLLMQMNMSW